MSHKKLNMIIAGVVFLISMVVLAITAQSGIPFWDCGESSAAAYLLQVPHPPGSPFHALVGRIMMMIPFGELAYRMNLLSALTGALTVTLTYLSAVILLCLWRGYPKNTVDKLIVYGSAVIGALAFSWSDSFWFIAVESTHFSMSLFLLALVTWLALHWYTLSSEEPHNEKYFLFITYLFGIAIGVHQLSLLAFFTVAMIYYFKRYEFNIKSFMIFAIVTVIAFVFVYKGVMTGIPLLLGSPDLQIFFVILIIGMVLGVYYSNKHKKFLVNFTLLASLMIILGYSTYVMIVIRANKGLALNENNPNTFEKLVPYLEREQYGDWPVVNFDKTKYDGKLFPRRWTTEDYRVARFKEYKSDWDYFVRYQFYGMWLRYLLWNYVGRAGDVQDAPPAFTGAVDPKWSVGRNGALPDKYYAIPLLIGLIGALYHLWKDKKMGLVVWSLFIVTGIGLMIYQNMQNPQPRERDYFFVGSFYVFAIWISLGVAGIIEMLITAKKELSESKTITTGILAILFLAVPINMVYQNFDNHNRNGNYLAWDFSYNLLQSCPKDAILFCVGDNDTFPVWYLQDAEGIRRDVRLVNLSLVNTEWYALQMKNETPYGAKKVPISYSDAEIMQMEHQFHEWERTKTINLPVSKETYKRFLNEEIAIANEYKSMIQLTPENYNDTTKFPKEISFNLKAFYSIPGQRGERHFGLRSQDLLVLDIVKTNNWERPICFPVMSGSDSRIGLDDYLKMEGLVYRLTPFKLNTNGAFMNPKALYEHLTKEPEGFSTEPALGYKFRNLNQAKLYFDENAMRTSQIYRQIFITLADYFVSYAGDAAKAKEILLVMKKKITEPPVTIDMRTKMNVLLMYNKLGLKDELQNIFQDIEKECLADIEKNPSDVNSQDNPYQTLIGVYELLRKYDRELEIYNKLMKYFPNDMGLKNKIEELKVLSSQNKAVDTTKK